MMEEVVDVHGIPNGMHADRGTAITSKNVALRPADLHIIRSHSRLKFCKDNTYSESWFKTTKFLPVLPERFDSVEQV